jgi:hypothetical protein
MADAESAAPAPPALSPRLPDPSSCGRAEFSRAAVRLYAEGGWIWDARPEDVARLRDACVPACRASAPASTGTAPPRRPRSWRVSAKSLSEDPDGLFSRPPSRPGPPPAVASPAPASRLPSEAGGSDAVPMLADLVGMGKGPESVSAAAVVSAVHGAGVAWGAILSARGPGATSRAADFASGLAALNRECPHPLLLPAAALAASGGLRPRPPRPDQAARADLRSLSIDSFESAPVPARRPRRPSPPGARRACPGGGAAAPPATRVVSVPDDGSEGAPWRRCVEVVKL